MINIVYAILGLSIAIIITIAWVLGIIRAFLYVYSSSISKSRHIRLFWAWLLSFVLGLTGISFIVGVMEIFLQWTKYRARKHMTQTQIESEGAISIWTEGRKDDVIKLIYAFVLWPLIDFAGSQRIITVVYEHIVYQANGNIAFATISFWLIKFYILSILVPLIIRFVIFRRSLKYGLEISIALSLSFFALYFLHYFMTGRYLQSIKIFRVLMIYCILSYQSSEYSEEWYSYAFNPIVFMLVILSLMIIMSGTITEQKQWYMPVSETIFACYIFTRHKNKTVSKEPEQPPKTSGQEPRQDTYEPPHQSARQATPDTANILIDTGLAHIGRKTYKANRYLTPEQTEARKRVERPFLRVLADNYRDEQSRKILARHFMVYKEVSLFMAFAFILKRDKELHNTVRERLKELLSQGLLSEVRKKWDENVYRISRTFYDEYKQTRELSHALKAAFCETVPEYGAVTAERLSELCDKDKMQRIFMYSYDAVLREYRKILEQT